MLIFESQRAARGQTRKLLFAFALTVALLVLAVNAALALVWGLSWGFWAPLGSGWPRHFFAVNTAVTLLFVLEKMVFGPQNHRRIVRFEELTEGA